MATIWKLYRLCFLEFIKKQPPKKQIFPGNTLIILLDNSEGPHFDEGLKKYNQVSYKNEDLVRLLTGRNLFI